MNYSSVTTRFAGPKAVLRTALREGYAIVCQGVALSGGIGQSPT
jgi:hypothetical protein